jgi:uncharacterized protein (DUF2132 family)
MGKIMMSSRTDRIAEAFCALTLAKPEWTHQAHLRVGLWHVLHFGEDDALLRLREGITRLNESHGVANTRSGGYHESITRFYVRVLACFLGRSGPSRPIDELAEQAILELGDKELPLRYWSRDLPFSPAARLGWVEPDLASLPQPVVARDPQEQPLDKPQPNNPLHGISLKTMLEDLVERRGWDDLGDRIRVRCFVENPSIASSLKFLRKTEWARAKVERLYLEDRQGIERNRKRNERRAAMRAFRAGQEAAAEPGTDVSDAADPDQ